MYDDILLVDSKTLTHHGVKGMKWGKRKARSIGRSISKARGLTRTVNSEYKEHHKNIRTANKQSRADLKTAKRNRRKATKADRADRQLANRAEVRFNSGGRLMRSQRARTARLRRISKKQIRKDYVKSANEADTSYLRKVIKSEKNYKTQVSSAWKKSSKTQKAAFVAEQAVVIAAVVGINHYIHSKI